LPEASKRLATTGEEIPPMVTGGIRERRTGFGIFGISWSKRWSEGKKVVKKVV
jgi:hypothetical protein